MSGNHIELSADYQTSGIWDLGPDGPGDIDPGSLEISDDLRAALVEWAERYDATFNDDDPMASGFTTPADEARFNADGEALAGRLRNELGSSWQVDHAPLPALG